MDITFHFEYPQCYSYKYMPLCLITGDVTVLSLSLLKLLDNTFHNIFPYCHDFKYIPLSLHIGDVTIQSLTLRRICNLTFHYIFPYCHDYKYIPLDLYKGDVTILPFPCAFDSRDITFDGRDISFHIIFPKRYNHKTFHIRQFNVTLLTTAAQI